MKWHVTNCNLLAKDDNLNAYYCNLLVIQSMRALIIMTQFIEKRIFEMLVW
jgi:hypothetical protein